MRLAQLRKQMIVAMGLPMTMSCGGTQPPPPPPPPGGDFASPPPGGGTTGGTIATGTSAGDCRPDAVPETVCGGVQPVASGDSCGSTGDTLTSYGESHLVVTRGQYGAHDPTFRDFVYDGRATELYRAKIAANPGLIVDHYCCYARCTPLRVAATAPRAVPPKHHLETRCFPAPPAGTSVPTDESSACPGAVELDGGMRPYSGGDTGICCYALIVADPDPVEERHYRGRAARVDGRARVAGVAAADAWRSTDVHVDTRSLPDEVRARLAAAWLAAARMEHASIASFANLSLRLLALGAPPALVSDAHAAALDEVEHARVAFALASTYAGTPVGPAPFGDAARMSAAGDLDALAIETFVDGCIGETVAALEAARAADAAADPAVAQVLRAIADDETRHAELAWAIVAWCVRGGAVVVPALQAALADAVADVGDGISGPADDLAAHGVLGRCALARVRSDALHDVVAPCIDALALAA